MYFRSESMAEPTLVTLDEAPSAVVRHRGVTAAALPPLFDAGYPAVIASGAEVADPAFALYRGDPEASFDLEIGFAVARPLAADVPGDITVEPSVLPGGRALALSHVGPYHLLPQSWAVLSAAAGEFGLNPTCFCEVYVTDPDAEPAPTSLRTDLLLIEPSEA